MTTLNSPRHILTLSCLDRPRIVGAVGTFLVNQRCPSKMTSSDHSRLFTLLLLEPASRHNMNIGVSIHRGR